MAEKDAQSGFEGFCPVLPVDTHSQQNYPLLSTEWCGLARDLSPGEDVS